MAYYRNFTLFRHILRKSPTFPIYRQYNFKINHQNKSLEINFYNKNNLILSTGDYALLANGNGICTVGNTSVLVTAVESREPKNGTDSGATLMVEYRNKYAAAGLVPPTLERRETYSTSNEVLVSRLIDRSLRPLFPKGYDYEAQITCNMLAMDLVNSPDILSINAASLALAVSDIPWKGPVAAVRVGQIDDTLVLNPTHEELRKSNLDLVVAGNNNKSVVMLEGKANIIPHKTINSAIKFGLKACGTIVNGIEEFASKYGKTKRQHLLNEHTNDAFITALTSLSENRLLKVFRNYELDKFSRDKALDTVRQDVVNSIRKTHPNIDPLNIRSEFEKVLKRVFREAIFSGKRCDGRKHNELRKISCSVDLHKPLHGSSLFQRGQTQVMATLTFDSPDKGLDFELIDRATNVSVDIGDFRKAKNESIKRFYLHYEFPPYATGEIGPVGWIGRREIGHGTLAEKALQPVVPQDHPFTIKLLSEVLQSNGSSSMATVCAGSLALMDAGVPIKSPTAGVAIGLVTKFDQENPTKLTDYRILADIMGIEDHLGDMDLKVASTADGITAIQADIKTFGVPANLMYDCIDQAISATKSILQKMNECMPTHRLDTKSCWPVSKIIEIEPLRRSLLLGIVGEKVHRLINECGVEFAEMEPNRFSIFAPTQASMTKCNEMINEFMNVDGVPEFRIGGIYPAVIVEMSEDGVRVILYNQMKPAFISIADLDCKRVALPSQLGLKVGQTIRVKYCGVRPVSGDARLSRKDLLFTTIFPIIGAKTNTV